MSDDDRNKPDKITRRSILGHGLRGAALVGLGGAGYALAKDGLDEELVWQIDPDKCTKCGNCANYCVLKPSAVKCVHGYDICGYCKICLGYFKPNPNELTTAAENQLCPTGAIERQFVESPYFEYNIDEDKCIGCAICVKGCEEAGNGSLFLQVRHNLCVNCNECAIAAACPADAFVRIPASQAYLIKSRDGSKQEDEG